MHVIQAHRIGSCAVLDRLQPKQAEQQEIVLSTNLNIWHPTLKLSISNSQQPLQYYPVKYNLRAPQHHITRKKSE